MRFTDDGRWRGQSGFQITESPRLLSTSDKWEGKGGLTFTIFTALFLQIRQQAWARYVFWREGNKGLVSLNPVTVLA
jgi:hypothetical protein